MTSFSCGLWHESGEAVNSNNSTNQEEPMEKIRVFIVGAGASGLMAAIAAARAGASVTVLEGMKKPGRKLLLTGNGRCNLTNLDKDLHLRYDSSGTDGAVPFVNSVLQSLDVSGTLRLFEELGLASVSAGSLVYPRSGQAQTVLGVLLAELERLHVKMKYNAKVKRISFSGEKGAWLLQTEGWTYEADRVVLCCGSKALPETGSDGSGYTLAASAGHTVTDIHPALTGFECGDPDVRAAAGARTKAAVKLLADTNNSGLPMTVLAKDTGEVQWTQYGLSGIVIFQLSRYAARRSGGTLYVSLDLVPDQTEEEVRHTLRRMLDHAGDAVGSVSLLNSYTHERVAAYLAKKMADKGTGGGQREEHIARALKNVLIPVTGLKGYDLSQICAGGISLNEVNPETLESLLCRGLFFAGEILDIDGPCGGYNLQWAWSSGYAAGTAASGTPGQ